MFIVNYKLNVTIANATTPHDCMLYEIMTAKALFLSESGVADFTYKSSHISTFKFLVSLQVPPVFVILSAGVTFIDN